MRASSTTLAWSGDLRRDENDTVTGDRRLCRGAVVVVRPRGTHPRGCARAGSTTTLPITSSPRPNPDDSGTRTYYNTSPIVGAVWHAADNLNVYFKLRAGLRDPDLRRACLHKPTGPGLNLELDPATSTAYELGLKWLPAPSQRLNLAVFTAKDQAGDRREHGHRRAHHLCQRRPHRRAGGVEAEWDADLGHGGSPRT